MTIIAAHTVLPRFEKNWFDASSVSFKIGRGLRLRRSRDWLLRYSGFQNQAAEGNDGEQRSCHFGPVIHSHHENKTTCENPTDPQSKVARHNMDTFFMFAGSVAVTDAAPGCRSRSGVPSLAR